MNHTTRHGTSAGFRGPARQGGYATLFVAVIALLLLTIMTLYFSRVAVMDLRMSGNEARYKEAFSAAMFGLDSATIALQNLNPQTLPAASFPIDPVLFPYTVASGEQQNFDVQMTRQTDPAGGIYFTVLSTGESADTTGRATVSKQFTLSQPFSLGAAPAPLVVGGTLNIGGGFEIVANPEGYCTHTNRETGLPLTDEEYCVHPDLSVDSCQGTDQPLSVLAESTAVGSSAASVTCRPDEAYPGDPNLDDTGCDKAAGLSDKQNITVNNPATGMESRMERNNYGIEDNFAGFPDNLFVATFGRLPDAMRDQVDVNHIIDATDCGNAADAEHDEGHLEGDRSDGSAGIWWVKGGGDCKLSGIIGAADSNNNGIIEHDPDGNQNFDDSEIHPAIIIVHESDLDIVANTKIYGIIFFLDEDKDGDNSMKMAGGATVYGSILANHDIPANANGDFVAAYDKRVLCSLQNGNSSPETRFLTPIQGSWRDF